ncbi:MAG: glycosyltransferase family 4 protein [Proteobacteria bacterium]|nr:glycosyltransferase family 4 protein [Pseudomonadota bacterium]
MSRVLLLVNHEIVIYNFRRELVEHLLSCGHEVHISSPPGEKIEKLKHMGCICHEHQIDCHGKNIFKDLALLYYYNKLLSKIKPDVVLTYTIKPNVYGGLLCRVRGVPFIVNISGLGTAFTRDSLLRKILIATYRFIFSKAKKVFLQNTANYEFIAAHHILCNNYKILPGSGVNLDVNRYEEYPTDTDGVVFLTIGRIMKDKGIDELLTAASTIKKTHPQVKFLLLGYFDDNYQTTIDDAVHRGIIEYLGYKTDVHDYIKHSHATIHPSYHEGMSNAILESAASGRPVIASNIPGCMEAVEDGVTGFLCEVKNAKSLTEKIYDFLLMTNYQRREMGKKARKKMEREFSRDLVVAAYAEEIDRV